MWGYMKGFGATTPAVTIPVPSSFLDAQAAPAGILSAEALAARGMEAQRAAQALRNAPGQAAQADMFQRQADALFAQARASGARRSAPPTTSGSSAGELAARGMEAQRKAIALRGSPGQAAQAAMFQRQADALFAQAQGAPRTSYEQVLAMDNGRVLPAQAPAAAPHPQGEVASPVPAQQAGPYVSTYVPGRVAANLSAQRALRAQQQVQSAPVGAGLLSPLAMQPRGAKIPKAVLYVAGGVAAVGVLVLLAKAVGR